MTMLESGQSTNEFPTLPSVTDFPSDEAEVWNELPGRPLRKKLKPLSIVLCSFLLAGGCFYAGVRVEKSKVGSSSGSGGASAASIVAAIAARTGASAGRTSGSGSGAAAGISGTIKLVDGSNVYVAEADGTVVKVSTNGGTTISVTDPGTVATLHPGDTVTVSGPTGSDGTISATSLRDSGATGTGTGTSRSATHRGHGGAATTAGV